VRFSGLVKGLVKINNELISTAVRHSANPMVTPEKPSEGEKALHANIHTTQKEARGYHDGQTCLLNHMHRRTNTCDSDAFSKINPAEITHYHRRNDILRLLITNERVSQPLHKTKKSSGKHQDVHQQRTPYNVSDTTKTYTSSPENDKER
jgi:hypothetical protein